METEWRELELLVKKIEKSLSRETTIIKSPDFLIDRVTGEKREVDISIQDKIGSTNILIVVECRNRNNSQDVRWIEEIKTKHNDLKASKIIAVSKNGFTKQAENKARFYNIELRTFDEITEDIIKEWNSSLEVQVNTVSYRVKTIQHVFHGNYKNVTPKINWAADTFKTNIIKINQQYLPIEAFVNNEKILDHFKNDSKKKEIGIRVRFNQPAHMATNLGELPVLEILITVDAYLEKEMINTKDINRYRDVLYDKIHEVAYYDVSEQMGDGLKIESFKEIDVSKQKNKST